MDTSKATARPWFNFGENDECDPEEPGKVWISIGVKDDAGCYGGEVAVIVNRTGKCTEQEHADAALIVRAVNSHEAVVAALRDLLDGSEPWDERATQARAALALAEQGGG